MARSTCEYLITILRGFTNAGAADYVIGNTSYFDDNVMQQILDRNRIELREAEMKSMPIYSSGGTVVYKEYKLPVGWLEETKGGTAQFVVSDGIGNVQGTALWSADYENGKVTFVADQTGLTRSVNGFAYDLYAAAADIWHQKAAYYATQIDFSTDNHSIKRGHIVAQCEEMAKRYESKALNGGGTSVDMFRGDQR